MKYSKLGILTAAMLGMCQIASADAFLFDLYNNGDVSSYAAWNEAGVTEDISDGAGGTAVKSGTIYNISGLTTSFSGASGGYQGGVPANAMLNDYLYVAGGTASISLGGLDTGVSTSPGFADMGGNTFTLQANQDYKLYLFGIGDVDTQDTTFTFGGVSKTTAGVLPAAVDSHYVTYEFTTGADVTGYSLDFTFSNNTAGAGAFNGLALVAVPEPATLGMITAFGGGLLFVRRRFMI